MESRKTRLGPSKFGVRYENQRASWQSERTLASWFLIWVDVLDYHEIQAFSWVLMTSEEISFSIAHLSPLKQLRCKSGQKLPWFVDEKQPKRTNSPSLWIASCFPLKAWTAKDKMQSWWSRVISSWSWLVLFWEDPGDFVTPWSDKDSLWNHHLTSFSHVFSDEIFKSFF